MAKRVAGYTEAEARALRYAFSSDHGAMAAPTNRSGGAYRRVVNRMAAEGLLTQSAPFRLTLEGLRALVKLRRAMWAESGCMAYQLAMGEAEAALEAAERLAAEALAPDVIAEGKRSGSCAVMRRVRIVRGWLNLATGERSKPEEDRVEWRVQPCATPLFGSERTAGVCRACSKAWRAPGNFLAHDPDGERQEAEERLAAAEADVKRRFDKGGLVLAEERIKLEGGALLVVRIFDGSPLAYFLTPERGRPAFAIERRAAVNRIAEDTPTAKDRASRTLYGRVLAARQAERV